MNLTEPTVLFYNNINKLATAALTFNFSFFDTLNNQIKSNLYSDSIIKKKLKNKRQKRRRKYH